MATRPIKVPVTATRRLYKLAEQWASASYAECMAEATDAEDHAQTIEHNDAARKAFKAALAQIETDAAALR